MTHQLKPDWNFLHPGSTGRKPSLLMLLIASQVLEIKQCFQHSTVIFTFKHCNKYLHVTLIYNFLHKHFVILSTLSQIIEYKKLCRIKHYRAFEYSFPQLLAGSTFFFKRKWWKIRNFASNVWLQLFTLSSSGTTIPWCCSGFCLWTWTCWMVIWASMKRWVSTSIPRAGVRGIRSVVPRVWKGCCCSVTAKQIS